MKYSYGFNPNNEYGQEIAPSMENYNSSLPNHEDYPRKVISQGFGFMDLFSLVMIIPFWIFVYKFFYLLVLPLVPISVLVFELVREVAPLNQLFMFGGSFLAAYIFYKGLKYLFKSLSLIEGTLLFIALYGLAIWGCLFVIRVLS
ncbi:MAG: Unknown protein [uncultured Sulfurovum sp.]|uniref:Uncharacterized protein n=1 Tax=uncultured Sulfurovum sp. TaxID=269237 RepID=A0A6S6U4T2_9BACT|nr:MAG: Unknown protein [uncultured Sulfurovum sp.]